MVSTWATTGTCAITIHHVILFHLPSISMHQRETVLSLCVCVCVCVCVRTTEVVAGGDEGSVHQCTFIKFMLHVKSCDVVLCTSYSKCNIAMLTPFILDKLLLRSKM